MSKIKPSNYFEEHFSSPKEKEYSVENVKHKQKDKIEKKIGDLEEKLEDELKDLDIKVEKMMLKSKKNLTREEFDIFKMLGLDAIIGMVLTIFKEALKPIKSLLFMTWRGVGGLNNITVRLFNITTDSILDFFEWMITAFGNFTEIILFVTVLSFINHFTKLLFRPGLTDILAKPFEILVRLIKAIISALTLDMVF